MGVCLVTCVLYLTDMTRSTLIHVPGPVRRRSCFKRNFDRQRRYEPQSKSAFFGAQQVCNVTKGRARAFAVAHSYTDRRRYPFRRPFKGKSRLALDSLYLSPIGVVRRLTASSIPFNSLLFKILYIIYMFLIVLMLSPPQLYELLKKLHLVVV